MQAFQITYEGDFPPLRKVKILWEGKKNWKNQLTKQLILLSSNKTSGRFFQLFVAFTEKLDFNMGPYD